MFNPPLDRRVSTKRRTSPKLPALQLNKTENKAHRVAELQIAEFKDKEKELQVREDKLLNLLLNNQIDQQAYERGLQLIRQGREDITNQLEALQKSLTNAVIETAKTVLELATSAKSLWIGRSTYERREFLNKVLSNPILDGLTVRYELKTPFVVLMKMREKEEWCPGPDLNRHDPVKESQDFKSCASTNFATGARAGKRGGALS